MKFVAESTYRMTNENGDLIISYVVKDKSPAIMAYNESKAVEGRLEIEVKQYKSKRSLEQNRLLWALLSKMAEAISGTSTRTTTEECYCDMLEEANVECDYILALPEAENRLHKAFRAIRKIDEREVNGKVLNMYQCFVGSSKFNTKQMTDLIETVLDRLAELGVYDSDIELAREEYR